MYYFFFSDCRTSKTDTGYREKGQLDTPCKFPFIVANVTYYSCTYDFGFVTGNKPWCSIKVDKKHNHISGNWGVCDDYEKCSIPERCKLKNKCFY